MDLSKVQEIARRCETNARLIGTHAKAGNIDAVKEVEKLLDSAHSELIAAIYPEDDAGETEGKI